MKFSWTVLTGIALLPFLYSGEDHPSQLEQVRQRGSMTLLTRNGASTYYLDAAGSNATTFALQAAAKAGDDQLSDHAKDGTSCSTLNVNSAGQKYSGGDTSKLIGWDCEHQR